MASPQRRQKLSSHLQLEKSMSNKSRERLKHEQTPYGNYHNYYFHRQQSVPDIRLKLLYDYDPTLLENKKVCDLGCNAGKLTVECVQYLHASSALGVDLDQFLIDDALKLETNAKVEFRCVDFMQDDRFFQSSQPDVYLLLSITKWLHLHNGDSGLIQLFKAIYASLPSGGVLVVEPQEWDNYKSAVKKISFLRESFRALELRPPFENTLEDVGFTLEKTIPREEGGFSRPLMVWRKK